MKKSLFLDELFEKVIKEYLSTEKIIKISLKGLLDKLKIKYSDDDFEKVEKSFLQMINDDNTDGNFSIDIDFPNSISSSEDDFLDLVQKLVDLLPDELDKSVDKINEAFSDSTLDAVSKTSELLFSNLISSFDSRVQELDSIQLNRVANIQKNWHRELKHLDTLRYILQEAYQQAKFHKTGVFSCRHKTYALNFLYKRVFNVIGEIISLLNSGYPDGALARWRSLHELSVVINFLSEQDDFCSKLYIQYSLIERLKLLESEYVGYPFTKKYRGIRKEIDRLKKQRIHLIKLYSRNFCNEYGWAAVYLKKKKITLLDLEELARLTHMRSKYYRANNVIHAGPLASLTRISLSLNGDVDSVIPPADGCEMSLDLTARSINILTMPLLLNCESFDVLSHAMVVQNYANNLLKLSGKNKRTFSKRQNFQ